MIPLTDLDLEVLADSDLPAFVPSADVCRATFDKYQAHQLLLRHGLPSPPTWLPGERAGRLPRGRQAAPGLGLALHPPVRRQAEADFFASYVKEPVMVQRFMDGPEFSVDALIDLDGRCLNAIPRTMLESRGGESIKGAAIADPELIELGRAVAEALPLRGPATIQMFRDTELGLRVTDINARFGGAFACPMYAAHPGRSYPELIVRLPPARRSSPTSASSSPAATSPASSGRSSWVRTCSPPAATSFRKGSANPGSRVIGREREQAALFRFVDADDGRGGVVVVHGAAGIGKSALLASVRDYALSRRCTVLTTAGVQTEAALPFAALERLLHGLAPRASRLPEPQRDALLAGLGLADATVTDHFLIGLATLNLLTDAAEGGRVIALVDDAQWLDAASADVLAFVARRIEFEPVGLVVGQRDGAGLRFEHATDLALGPLDEASARSLLERTPLPAATQRRVLTLAAGNPLALVELPLSADAGGLLPLTERLERSFTAQQADLAPSTRALLRVAAADDSDETSELLAAADAGEADVEAAVSARLLERDGTRVRFRHPLIRSALYQAASELERRAAHAAIAAVITDAPHRRAWHRAAGSDGPDEAVATALDRAADDARRRGAVAAAVDALQRASELSTDREHAVTRLLTAAELSVELGNVDVVGRAGRQGRASRPGPAAQARDPLAQGGVRRRGLRRRRAGPRTARRRRAPLRPELKFRLLLAAGTRCWWAVDGDHPVRDEVVAAALDAGAADDDPASSPSWPPRRRCAAGRSSSSGSGTPVRSPRRTR